MSSAASNTEDKEKLAQQRSSSEKNKSSDDSHDNNNNNNVDQVTQPLLHEIATDFRSTPDTQTTQNVQNFMGTHPGKISDRANLTTTTTNNNNNKVDMGSSGMSHVFYQTYEKTINTNNNKGSSDRDPFKQYEKPNDKDLTMNVVLEALEKSEIEDKDVPEWKDGVDRFTNFVTKEKFEPKPLMEEIKKILEELKTDAKLPYSKTADVFTYIAYKNYLICKILIDECMCSDFAIGVFKYEGDKALIDIQELSGEHLTFSQFLEEFKSVLGKQLVDIHSFPPELLNTYGLDMEISLDAFN